MNEYFLRGKTLTLNSKENVLRQNSSFNPLGSVTSIGESNRKIKIVSLINRNILKTHTIGSHRETSITDKQMIKGDYLGKSPSNIKNKQFMSYDNFQSERRIPKGYRMDHGKLVKNRSNKKVVIGAKNLNFNAMCKGKGYSMGRIRTEKVSKDDCRSFYNEYGYINRSRSPLQKVVKKVDKEFVSTGDIDSVRSVSIQRKEYSDKSKAMNHFLEARNNEITYLKDKIHELTDTKNKQRRPSQIQIDKKNKLKQLELQVNELKKEREKLEKNNNRYEVYLQNYTKISDFYKSKAKEKIIKNVKKNEQGAKREMAFKYMKDKRNIRTYLEKKLLELKRRQRQ